MPLRRLERAFTLIEMLVVISIVALLLTILIPTIQQSKAIARVAICSSNMRQIGGMLAQYNADCNQFIPPPRSPHQIAVGASGAGNDRFSTNQLTDVTTNTAVGQGCPYGYPRNWPNGFAWFYWMGYLPPVPKNGKIGILDCPDAPIYPDAPSYKYNLPYTALLERNYNTFSIYTTAFANNDLISGAATNPGGGNIDCSPEGMIGYWFRGWQKDYSNVKVFPRIDLWKPSLAVAVDNEVIFTFANNWQQDLHGDGLNILFVDGHVGFGGRDINFPAAGTNAAVKPYYYYSVKTNNYSYATAIAGSGSGWAYPGGNGTIALWNYYETGQQ